MDEHKLSISELEKQFNRKSVEMKSIQQIGRALSSELRIERLLMLVIQEVNNLMDSERGTFYIVDKEKGELWSKVAQDAEILEIRLKIGVGIAGHVAKTGDVINIPDAYKDDRFNPAIDKKTGFKTRSILCMPIFEASKDAEKEKNIIGVLQILNKREGVFEEEDEELLASMASQIAIAINNSNLYSKLEKKVNELDLLFDIERELNKAYDLNELLNILIEKITETIVVEAALITLRDRKTNEYSKRVVKNIDSEKANSLHFSGNTGIVGKVVQSGELYFSNDVKNDKLFSEEFSKKLGVDIKHLVCVPLKINDEVIGILEVYNKSTENDYFSSADIRLLSSLSGQISRAIETFQLKEEKIKADRLSSIGNMMSTIVHDLRTPMGNIYGFVDLLQDEDDAETRKEYSEIITQQIKFLTNMTTDVLDFAKGKSSILPVKCAVNKILEEFQKFFEGDVKKKGFEFETACNTASMIYVDPEKIQRIFMNIMKNGLEAMEPGGKFSITANKEKNDVVFLLSDTGAGIPDEIKQTLFDSFVTSGKKGGTGLGLAIVKKLIEEQKGRIEVESEVNKGTTFKIYFPRLS
ncbi:MAG: GAF domain-containing protein [Calditrichaeota bacterium]|nr:MAG: GAF domain-containing protein [Calditrichota bacterium]MBL1205307.1 GAF domain-containing protein [Calditrichota bacterium]NOG45136.1 GAF domain-containing protein [Calditrichota bacterium]